MSTTMREVIPSGNEYIAIATVEAFQGTAEAVSWSNVTGKPEEFPPEAHNHSADTWLLNIINPFNQHVENGDLHVTADILLKIAGVAENANNYIHPASHDASMINQDATHRFATDAEKAAWNGKAEESYVDNAISALVGSAPELLNSLDEIAQALQDNPDVISDILTSLGQRVLQTDFNSHTGDNSLHVTQAILDKIEGLEAGGLTSDNITITKTTVKTWQDVYNEIVALGITNMNACRLEIVLDPGTHAVGDYFFNNRILRNGLNIIRGKNDIAGDYGSGQTSIIDFNGDGGFEFDGDIDVKFRSVGLKVSAGGNMVPISCRKNNTLSSEKCFYDASSADDDVQFITLANGKFVSDNDTVKGHASHSDALVDFGNGVENLIGGEVLIFDAHYDTTAFAYGVIGKGSVVVSNANGAFVTNTHDGAVQTN